MALIQFLHPHVILFMLLIGFVYFGTVDKGQGRGVDGVGQNFSRGGPQAPAVRLCGSAEVTPTRVGIRAAGHPWDQQRVRAGRGRDRKGVPPGTV